MFAFGEFVKLEGLALTVFHAPDQGDVARDYADSAEQAERVLADWFGPLKNKPQVVALRDPNAAAFESGNLVLAPLRPMSSQGRQLVLARPLVHGSMSSSRRWVSEGLARFGQALVRERQTGRASANEFLAQVLPALIQTERSAGSAPEAANRAERDSLINTNDELLYTGKAAYVWWMLRDIVGDAALTKAIAAYRPEQDRDAAYVQQLIEAQFTPRRDLQAFFDSWVYHDYGLPDLRIDAANARQTMENNYRGQRHRREPDARLGGGSGGGERRQRRYPLGASPGAGKREEHDPDHFSGCAGHRRSQRRQRAGTGSLEQQEGRAGDGATLKRLARTYLLCDSGSSNALLRSIRNVVPP